MAGGRLTPVIRFLRGIPAPHGVGDATDVQLLYRFAAGRDEAAFAALVRRHGPMVLAVCRRLLAHEHDAEDAFQATFLVLALKAGSVARPESLGSWLHGVARRTALKARARAARRQAAERQVQPEVEAVPDPDPGWSDLRPILDEEVGRLPARHRAAFVLCCLEGRTNAEAAGLLGCPEGTVASRLSWARRRLRSRLTRRGLAPSAIVVATVQGGQAIAANVPPTLAGYTIKAAAAVAAGKAAAGTVPPQVVALAEGVLGAMFATRLWMAAAVVGLALAGAAALAAGLRAEDRPASPRPAVVLAAAKPEAVARGEGARDEAKDEVTLETVRPVVVKTVPEAGTGGLVAKLGEIKVTFSKDMLDGSWSWATFGEENFPKVNGKPKYLDDKRTAVLPVKLEPGKTYALWINSENYGNFKDAGGRSAVPYLLVFKTKK
jgi:RNA polymerase sigma factor (sigma-70 family)